MGQPTSSKALLTTLTVIYFSLVMVMTFFGLIVFYLNFSGTNAIVPDEGLAQLLRYVLFGLTPAGVIAGYFVFKQQMSSIGSTLSLRTKLLQYQTAILIRSACIELPGLFAAMAAMITGDNSFLLVTLIMVVIFIVLRPTPFTITNDLGLSQAEKSILENPDSNIE